MKLLGTVPAGTMKSSAVHFQPGDVLYGRLRPYLNKVYRPDFEGLCSAEFIVFPKTEGVDSRYLQYFLNSSTFVSFASHLNTGDRPRVDFDQLAPYEFPLAPLEQQKRIVVEIEKQFSRLDEAVANLKRVKANLKRYKAAVLKAAVEGRLVETEAEIARREGRSYETGEQLLQRILETRRSQWQGKRKYKEPTAPVTTDLPGLPEGWVWATVDQLFMSLRNGLSKKPEDSGPGIPILRISAVRPLELDITDKRFYRPLPSEHVEEYELKLRDVLFVRYNGTKDLVGACALVNEVSGVVLYPDKLIRGRVVCDLLISPSYLVLAANVGKSREHVDVLIKTTAGQQGIAGGEIKKMPLPLPPIEEQHRIVAEVDRRLSLLRGTEAQVDANLQRAGRFRQSILSKAFSA
ncbi:hypothetical protein Thpro_022429 [Acidihalobacter prosperus]|uniref:Type I restriction modification DNA specificity domain-containing protein n=2 Tax=Acidihalobacter prosperus TaxID=160660 RepID=A0A1A6C0V3_9GAMM|nr:hypothetical protein Thpro_022429 [Acidihalobacter prosperus]